MKQRTDRKPGRAAAGVSWIALCLLFAAGCLKKRTAAGYVLDALLILGALAAGALLAARAQPPLQTLRRAGRRSARIALAMGLAFCAISAVHLVYIFHEAVLDGATAIDALARLYARVPLPPQARLALAVGLLLLLALLALPACAAAAARLMRPGGARGRWRLMGLEVSLRRRDGGARDDTREEF